MLGTTEKEAAGPAVVAPNALRDETVAGQLMGTVGYMAPEQAAGNSARADERTDVYGLGALLYLVLTGRAPLSSRAGLDEALRQVCEEAPPRPRQLWPGAPAALEAICLRCVAKRPEERYATAAALAADVQRRWLRR